ncbi:aminoglycoside phosphotransferase family protein [Nocardioides marinus]|jgi:aminoglycoside phosphotransferase (APT) family kinase protein|uniref:Aminoglycoside phosphotransferase (APT) family kinase protein n=1 Tax=Nocardioides marinus TaxID=374514 RepID=A0A7Z0C4W4_9ACTN|nr:aminoglycoside phosphotransferase family protein [Nocardioides marinus]NYI10511.1 aminoglycoside phosphotransferase (APT) family kinase protein [Nocardioides marinus]
MSDAHDAHSPTGFADMRPLPGGWSGRTFLAEAGGERTVVRVHEPEDRDGPTRDAAVLALAAAALEGCAPVPGVVEVREGDPASGAPGLLLTEHLPGERGDLLLPRLDDQGLASAGAALGEVVARLAGTVQPRPGRFAGATLEIEEWEPPWDTELVVELGAALAPRLGLDEAQARELAALCRHADDVLGDSSGAVLVHGDLNPKNVLLEQDPGGAVRVSGVLDWEFAHAGTVGADLGNLVRFDRSPAYVDAVLGTVAQRRGVDEPTLLERARAVDLVAVMELATRRGTNPVAERAHRQLVAMVRAGDLHATADAP